MNYQFDIIGRPIKVGDTVITKGFGSPIMNFITVVKKVNKKTVSVIVEKRTTVWGKYDSYSGTYPDRAIIVKNIAKTRFGNECLVIPENFEEEAKREQEEFKQKYPRIFL